MTVGNLFLVIIVTEIFLFATSYLLYKRSYNTLRKAGYKHPEDVSPLSFWILTVHGGCLVTILIISLLWGLVINWNTPI